MLYRHGFKAIMAVLFVLIHGGVAWSANVSCGDVVTQDVVLDGDLTCAGGYGIIIGADNITLDGDGYTISRTAYGAVKIWRARQD